MIIYFCLYAFLGYLLESFYRSILERKWISSGLLDCPFIPLYGFGAICLLIYEKYFQFNPIIGGCILIILEFISSYIIEIIFHTRYWNYNKHILNYDGRICLLYGCIWIFMSYIFQLYIHPFIMNHIYINIYRNITSIIIIIIIILKSKKRISENLS